MALHILDLKELIKGATFVDLDSNRLLYPFKWNNEKQHIIADIYEDGELVRFRIPDYLNIQSCEDKAGFALKLLQLNRKKKLLQFCYDPIDQEVEVSIEIAIEDSVFTSMQANRCIYFLRRVAMDERDRLLHFLQEGSSLDESDIDVFKAVEQMNSENSVTGEDTLDDAQMNSVERMISEAFATDTEVLVTNPSDNETPLFIYKSSQKRNRGINATGAYNPINRQFIVKAGSTARLNEVASMNPRYQRVREQLRQEGVLTPTSIDGQEVFRFTVDYSFNSPSEAGAIITGSNFSGYTLWKINGGEQTLEEWIETNSKL